MTCCEQVDVKCLKFLGDNDAVKLEQVMFRFSKFEDFFKKGSDPSDRQVKNKWIFRDHQAHGSMASFIESQPVFESRLKASGLTSAIYDKFKAQNIVSLSQLAFISSYTPGGADVFEKVIEREASVAERASFRRLFHEAYAAVTTEMRQTIENAEETSSRLLTQPDRADRYQEQSKRLVGVSIKGRLEPSGHLIDICCGIYKENRLKYVEWSKRTSRESELQCDPNKDASFTLDSTTGRLKVETKTSAE